MCLFFCQTSSIIARRGERIDLGRSLGLAIACRWPGRASGWIGNGGAHCGGQCADVGRRTELLGARSTFCRRARAPGRCPLVARVALLPTFVTRRAGRLDLVFERWGKGCGYDGGCEVLHVARLVDGCDAGLQRASWPQSEGQKAADQVKRQLRQTQQALDGSKQDNCRCKEDGGTALTAAEGHQAGHHPGQRMCATQ